MGAIGRFFIGFLVLTGSVGLSHATSFYERPFSEAVEDAPVVVRGKIGPSTTKWALGIDGTKRIYTYIELRIDEVFKGDVKGHTLTMRELGGEKDGVGMQVSGTAEFNSGEDTVVFLDQAQGGGGDPYYDVRGMMMGKFNIAQNDGAEYLVGAGIAATDHPVLRNHASRANEADGRWTIAALRELIQVQDRAAAERKISLKSPVAPAPPAPVISPPAPSLAANPAPGLQTSAAEADVGPSPVMKVWMALALLAASVVGFVTFRGFMRLRKK